MDFVRLTEKEKSEVLSNLEQAEKDILPIAESIMQKIAGVYINRADYHPEIADIYRNVASSISDLIAFEKKKNNRQ